MILSKMSEWFTYELMLGVGVVIAVLSLVLVTIVGNRFRPEAEKTEA